jgi:hypothetical protein
VKEDDPSSLIKSSTNAIVKTLQDEEIYAEQVGDTEVIGNAKGINLAHIRANQESTIAYLEEKFRTLEEKLKNDNKRLREMFRKENDRLKEELQDTRESLETRLEDIQSAAYNYTYFRHRFISVFKRDKEGNKATHFGNITVDAKLYDDESPNTRCDHETFKALYGCQPSVAIVKTIDYPPTISLLKKHALCV